MDESQTLRSMVRDDAYHVIRTLADGPSGTTQLVTLDGEGPLVRKSMPLSITNAAAWAAAMDIDEPLLPRIESLYRMPDRLVVVYDYVEGQSVADTIRDEGPMTPEKATAVICDVCTAVSALHACGVVHRDITPGNVILAEDGAHLVDLGIARQQVHKRSHDTTTLGTWGFASPEQYGFAQTDARSDVYSLGRLLGYMLTGFKPDAESYEVALDDRQLVDEELARVVLKATAFEPSARYQSAQELADALSTTCASRRGAMTGPTPSQRERVGQGFAHAGTATHASYAQPSVSSDDVRRFSLSAEPNERVDQGAFGFEVSDAWERQQPKASFEVPEVSVAPLGEQWAYAEVPTGGQRAYAEVPTALRLLVSVYCVALGLLALLVGIASIDALITGEPKDFGPAQHLMSVCVIAGLLKLAYEARRAVTYAAPYTNDAHPVRLFLYRSLSVAMATLALMFLAAIIFGR